MAVTNAQLMAAIESLDKRVLAVESILMSSKLNRGTNECSPVSPLTMLLIRWVVFPLIVIVGGAIGVTQVLPLGG